MSDDPSPIFVAADALVARHDPSHPQHRRARALWAELATQRPPLVTVSACIGDALTELARRTDPAFAAARGRSWALSRHLEVVPPNPGDHLAALAWLVRYKDPAVNMTDCWSFAVCERLRLRRVFSFRECFPWAGFAVFGGE
jgi:predicted nucleic acid-binding protein